MRRGDLLKGSRAVDAMLLRTNTAPTRALAKRIDPNRDDTCRKCKEGKETLGHILGLCLETKARRIRRHDEIKELLRDDLSRKHAVLCEQEVQVRGERFKPDLVVNMNEKGVVVIDVTVRYENKNHLALGAAEKVQKYKAILGQLKRDLNARTARVVPIVVGSRGALPGSTIRALRSLGVAKKHWLTISLIALRSSIEIYNSFMDYN